MFDEDKILDRNRQLMEIFEEQVGVFQCLPHVGEVRWLGMVFAVELVIEKRSKSVPIPPNGPGWKIAQALFHKGIWLRPLHNVLYVIPPYSTTSEELRWVMRELLEALKEEKYWE